MYLTPPEPNNKNIYYAHELSLYDRFYIKDLNLGVYKKHNLFAIMSCEPYYSPITYKEAMNYKVVLERSIANPETFVVIKVRNEMSDKIRNQ